VTAGVWRRGRCRAQPDCGATAASASAVAITRTLVRSGALVTQAYDDAKQIWFDLDPGGEDALTQLQGASIAAILAHLETRAARAPRALAVEPDLLLMDEPFGALDAITRQSLQDELRRIWRETEKSILFVTHDIEAAVYLGQRVLLLGGSQAHIVSSFDVADHASRDAPAVMECVRAIKTVLHATLAIAPAQETALR